MKQFLKNVADVEKIMKLSWTANEIYNKSTSVDAATTKLMSEMQATENTLQQFLTRMLQQYPLYKDLLSPFLAGVSQVNLTLLAYGSG